MRIFALIFALYWPSLASAEIVDFPVKPLKERMASVLQKLRSTKEFEELDTFNRTVLYYRASSTYLMIKCLGNKEAGIRFTPDWFDTNAVSNWTLSLTDPINGNRSMQKDRTVAWALVGLIATDDSPCELAKEFYERSALLN